MTSENKTWESVKTDYLHQVEKALSSVRHPRKREVLEDVRSHLDRRFAELRPDDQTWENFQAIITEMGPASDYAELLESDTTATAGGTRQKHVLWVTLVVSVIVITIILLTLAIFPKVSETDRKVASLISEMSDPNAPRFVALNRIIKLGSAAVPTLIEEMKTNYNWQIPKALGAIGDKRAILPLIEKLEKSNYSPMREVVGEALERITGENFGTSKEKWRTWWREHQQKMNTQDKAAIETYIVTFKPVAPFTLQTARQLLDAFNEKHPRGVRTHHYRAEVRDDALVGYICVDTKAGKDAVVSMLEKNEKLEFIETKLATDDDLQKLYKMGQPSLPKSTSSQEMYRALPESPNRKLLDEQTRAQLRRHEQFSAGWFKIEEAYEAASASDKNKMIKQWIADANGSDFDKMTKAIAALGNVAAKEAVDVLINIGQKPKGGNRPRWMAVRALGRIGDMKAVPLLINLLDHYNSDTRLYAKVALAEITGVYFGDSKEKWINWARQQGIEVKQMDVSKKPVSSAQNSASRTRSPQTPNKTVSRTGELPDEMETELERLNRPEAGNERKLLQELQEAQEQWLKNKEPDALKKCDSLIEQIIKQPKPSAQAYFTTAMAADLLERPEQAILILKKAVAECPDERAGGLAVPVKISGYFRIGAIARQLGDAEEATKAYDSAIKNSQGVRAEEFCKACCFMYLAEIASEILKDEQLALKRIQKAIAAVDAANLNKLSRDLVGVYAVLKDWASYEYEKLKYKKTPVIDESKDIKLKHEGVFGLTMMSTSLNGLEHPLLLKKVADSEKSPIDSIFAKFTLAIVYSHELNLSPSEAEKYLSNLVDSGSYFAPYAKMMLQMVQQ